MGRGREWHRDAYTWSHLCEGIKESLSIVVHLFVLNSQITSKKTQKVLLFLNFQLFIMCAYASSYRLELQKAAITELSQ